MTIVDDLTDGVKFAEVIKIDEGKLRQHVKEVVGSSVEETLNGLLEAEADELCEAKRYERSAGAARHSVRALRSKTRHEGRKGDVEGAAVAEPAF